MPRKKTQLLVTARMISDYACVATIVIIIIGKTIIQQGAEEK